MLFKAPGLLLLSLPSLLLTYFVYQTIVRMPYRLHAIYVTCNLCVVVSEFPTQSICRQHAHAGGMRRHAATPIAAHASLRVLIAKAVCTATAASLHIRINGGSKHEVTPALRTNMFAIRCTATACSPAPSAAMHDALLPACSEPSPEMRALWTRPRRAPSPHLEPA